MRRLEEPGRPTLAHFYSRIRFREKQLQLRPIRTTASSCLPCHDPRGRPVQHTVDIAHP